MKSLGIQYPSDLLVKAEEVKTIPAIALFGERSELNISHLDKVYRLAITKQNKLILTKLSDGKA
jgi:hemin uptake protein HemP